MLVQFDAEYKSQCTTTKHFEKPTLFWFTNQQDKCLKPTMNYKTATNYKCIEQQQQQQKKKKKKKKSSSNAEKLSFRIKIKQWVLMIWPLKVGKFL